LFFVMPALNLFAIGSLTGIGSWLALRQGRSPWLGCWLPLGCNAGIALLHNFTDAFSTLTVVGLLAAWRTGAREAWIFLWSLLAVLSREQNIVIVALALGAAAWNGRLWLAARLVLVLGLWCGWVVWLRGTYGAWPFLPSQGNLGPPGDGLLYRCAHLGMYCGYEIYSPRLALIHAASLAQLLVLLLVAGAVSWRDRGSLEGAVAAIGIVLTVLAGTYIYRDFWSYTRVLVWVPLGAWFGGLRCGRTWPFYCLVPGLFWPLVGALNYA
jgi:hypothetical protein